MTTVLPSVPSALIKLALSDLAACENDPRYDIDMSYWHRPHTRGIPFITRKTTCEVCLAGSVMAQTLQCNIDLEVGALDFNSEDTVIRLLALDHFRIGSIRMGIKRMCSAEDFEKLPSSMYHMPIKQYYISPVAWLATMHEFVEKLEEVGL